MKIALIGYGKMGKEIEKIARSRGHEIVSIIDIDNRQDFASEAFRSADVAIEFTAPSVAYGNCMEAFKNGVKVVSGSTGWMGEHGDEMRRLCQEEGKTLFWSSNFSLGVAIFSAVNKYLARIMNNFPNYEVSMVETHHIHKLDAPSGTAITLAEGILENLDRKDKWVMEPSAERPSARRTNCLSALSAKGKFRVSIPLLTNRKPTPSSLRTMPRTVKASHWARYWLQNILPHTPVSWV